MPTNKRGTSLIQRSLVGFWFCGIAALGFVRFFMRAFRSSQFEADTVTWLWLTGAVIMAIAGIAVIARAASRGRATTIRD